jgi:hypothetical protein
MKKLSIFAVALFTLSFGSIVHAQKVISTADKSAASELKETRDNLVAASAETKKSSANLATLQEEQIKAATAKLEQLRQLYSEGLISRNEVEESEKSLNDLKAKLEATRQQAAAADQIIAEVRASEEQAKKDALQAKAAVKSFTRPVLMRYNGPASWSVVNLGIVQNFFQTRFGRALPTSTIGQSATHNRLGWDHRHAVDVGLHPDSVEGRALIDYLQSQGIPYLAFRAAVPGVSTGPHIHIGTPSHRLG